MAKWGKAIIATRQWLAKDIYVKNYEWYRYRERHEKVTDNDNSSYMPEMKSLEPGQTDRQ